MLATFKKIVTSLIREHISKPKERSPKWSKVRKEHLKNNPYCAACGSKMFPQVHHIKPFHLEPELELDPNNLITLCMGLNKCHLDLGHGDDFKAVNPKLLNEIALLNNEHPVSQQTLNECKIEAKKIRIYTEPVE